MNKKSKIRNSFTLVELLVTISIAALIMAIGIPSFLGIARGARAKEANNLVQSMLKQAQQQAMITRQRVGFFIVTKVCIPNPYVSEDMVGRSFFLYAPETPKVSQAEKFLTSVQTLPAPMMFDLSNSNLPMSALKDDNGVIIIELRGFRFAPAGGIFWTDAQPSASSSYSYNVVITEGIGSANGTYTAKTTDPIKYTNAVNVFTGRISTP